MYLSILSYAGNIASALNIILVAKKITKNRLIWLIAALLSAFGGNFACNLVLLSTKQATRNIPCEINLIFISVIMVIVIFAHGTETAKPNCNTVVKIMEFLNELAFITEYLGECLGSKLSTTLIVSGLEFHLMELAETIPSPICLIYLSSFLALYRLMLTV